MSIVAAVGSLPVLFLMGLAGWILVIRIRHSYLRRRMGLKLRPQSLTELLTDSLGILWAMGVVVFWLARACCRNGLRQPRGVPTGPPVLCVHGFLMTGAAMWGIRRALEAAVRPTQAVSLGWPSRSIESYSVPLRKALEELCRTQPGTQVDIVAHSMGGIVVRHLLAVEPRFGRCVRRIVTLGTPHQGTPVSGVLPVGREVKQMARGSAFLRDLPDFRHSAPQAEVTTVATARDQVVFPTSAAHLPGVPSITLTGMPHIALLTNPRSIDCVVGLLTGPEE